MPATLEELLRGNYPQGALEAMTHHAGRLKEGYAATLHKVYILLQQAEAAAAPERKDLAAMNVLLGEARRLLAEATAQKERLGEAVDQLGAVQQQGGSERREA
eukprot:CAMPEP_0119124506 /NCGR_PEP_ID=MMETSP1310-20130426/4112_1 /TAXON_ID=464262 /ORGANISM="Genus nov. species nov., Strain RCC2339" /LENGTH=102 /DNA_ID=CAMNT_0007114469 /DNA_START=40 /DNA_END=348 /DNA_ORIENTATION=-